jgi:hypothetical protein
MGALYGLFCAQCCRRGPRQETLLCLRLPAGICPKNYKSTICREIPYIVEIVSFTVIGHRELAMAYESDSFTSGRACKMLMQFNLAERVQSIGNKGMTIARHVIRRRQIAQATGITLRIMTFEL